jgi:tetratricopeptide (TPR) repeat protein
MRTVACAFAVAMALLLGSSVLAEPRPTSPPAALSTVEKASASFRQGVQLYREGSFEAALAEFKKAYQLRPSYRVLYNIAQTYYELHDYVSASKNIKQYMLDGGNDIDPARRSEVEELNQKLDERIAYLEIITNLDGADIRVDDIPSGVSPLPSPLMVNAGPRRISAVKAGYTTAARSITVAGKDRVKVTLDIPEPTVVHPMERSSATKPSPFTTQSSPTVIKNEAPAHESRTAWVVSLTVAASCAVATGVFGWLALNAKKDFDNQLNAFPSTKSQIDDSRSKMQAYAYVTDGFAAATLVSGGVALYMALAGQSESKRSQVSYVRPSVKLTPTLGGMVLHGAW